MTQDDRILDSRFAATRIAGWFRWFTGVICAIAVSLLIVHVTVRDDLIAACQRSAERVNADANNWSAASDVRSKQGDISTSQIYNSNVITIRHTIAMPDNWDGDPLTRGMNPLDRKLGCKDSYHTLVPFVK